MNIDDITAKVKKISMETVAEVQKMNEVRSLGSQINAQKKMIQAMYTEMGKKLFDKFKEAPLEGFESDFQSLDAAFENIEQLQGQIRLAKGVTLCPNCKMEVGLDERFCSNCGSKMPEVFRIVEDEPEEVLEDNIAKSEDEVQAQESETLSSEESPEDKADASPEESPENRADASSEENSENRADASLEEFPEDKKDASSEENPEDKVDVLSKENQEDEKETSFGDSESPENAGGDLQEN
ncbi:MAG: hypothetical protein LIO99_05680 [Clostridiales bacterium]|nr:hypothetical protein [Clostridiales bacterium]